MDWNKTKTIFIIVFSILNVFLYSLYLNRLTDAQNVQVMGKTSMEESLKWIIFLTGTCHLIIKDPSYVSAEISTFTNDKLQSLKTRTLRIVDETHLKSILKEPVSITNTKGDMISQIFFQSMC